MSRLSGKIGVVVSLSLIFAGCAHREALREESRAMLSSLALPIATGGQFQPHVLREQVVVVYFLSSWCFSCLADLPVLQDIHQSLGASGVTVVAVGLDLDGEKTLRPFAEQFELPFPLLVGNADLIEGRSPFGRIRGLPTTVLFNRDGAVEAAYHGSADAKKLKAYVEKMVRR